MTVAVLCPVSHSGQMREVKDTHWPQSHQAVTPTSNTHEVFCRMLRPLVQILHLLRLHVTLHCILVGLNIGLHNNGEEWTHSEQSAFLTVWMNLHNNNEE